MVRRNTQQHRGFFGTIIGLIVMVVSVAALFYFFFMRSPVSLTLPSLEPTVEPGSSVVEEAPTSTAPVIMPTATSTFSTSIEAKFEGTDKISFSLEYLTDLFLVTKSNDQTIQLVEKLASTTSKATSTTHTIFLSYEGGRGYEPKDYWTNIAKKNCPSCTLTTPVISIAGASTTLTYHNADKVVQISSAPQNLPWLIVFTLKKPIVNVRASLSTFKVTGGGHVLTGM